MSFPIVYQKYFNNDDKKVVVSAYMKGLNWIHQYYYNRNNEGISYM